MKVIVLFLASLIGSNSQEWSYEDESTWPGQCNTGDLQSPINIKTRETIRDPHEAHIRGPLVFRGYGRVTVTAENTGHSLQWNKAMSGQAPVLSGGPLRGNYTFLQFHLHWLSEHAIDGMKYPMEIHLVHIKTGLTMDEALNRSDGLAVIGILCEVKSDERSKQALAEIMPVIPQLLEKTEEQSAPMDLNFFRFMSSNLQSYYTYHGSLTTPNCQEVVTWIVMNVPININDMHYKELSKVNIGGIDNFRSLQPVNRRPIYRSAATCSFIYLPGLIGSLTGLLNCISSSLNIGQLAGPKKIIEDQENVCVLWDVKRKFSRRGRNIKECQSF